MFKTTSDDAYVPAGTLAEDLGKLILRWSVGILMLLHGIAKLQKGIDPVRDMVESAGLPSIIAYGVYVGEVVVPVLLILGILTRWSALVFVVNMIAAIYLGHRNDLGSLNQFGGWAVELPMLYLTGALAIVFLGAGRFAIMRRRGLLS